MPWGKDQVVQPAADQAASASSGTGDLPSWGRGDQKATVVSSAPEIRTLDVMRQPSLGDVVNASLINNRAIDDNKIASAQLGQSVGDVLNAPELRPVGAGEAAGRGYVSGGGQLLQSLGALASNVLPAPGVAPNAQLAVPEANLAGAPLTSLGNQAVESQAITPQERLAGTGAKVAFLGAEQIPTLAAAIGTGGTLSAEAALPAALRNVPVLGRLASNIAAGAPTAGVLTGEQVASSPEDMSLGDIARTAGLNLAMAGVPGAIGEGQLARTVTGGAIGSGLAAGSNYLNGQPFDPASTIVGGLTGAALAGGHGGAEKMDPYLARYEASKFTPDLSGPARLPAPEAPTAGPTPEPVAPITPEAPAVAAAPVKFDPAQATRDFQADPRAALDTLDHATLSQLAGDVGLDVGPNEKRVSIISKIAGQPAEFLHSDVLPEYLAAAQDAHEALQAAAPAPQANVPPEPTVDGLGDLARSLNPSSVVPVDAQGTAYTPEQGMGKLSEAIQAQAGATTRALPPAIATVDSAGNLVNSEAQNRQMAQRLADEQAGIEAAKARRELGLTPDIERTQRPKWEDAAQRNAASAADVATREADRRAMADARESSDLAQQGENDAPPWWLAGQHAEQQHEAAQRQALEPLRQEIGWDERGGRLLRDPETGDVTGRTPWTGKAGPLGESNFWRERPTEGGKINEQQANAALDKFQAGTPLNAREQRFIDYAQAHHADMTAEFQKQISEMEAERLEQRDSELATARDELTKLGIAPEDHEEALTLSQLIGRAYEAGVPPQAILATGDHPDNASRARALWDVTRRYEEQAHAEPSAIQQAGAGDRAAATEGAAAAGAAQPARSAWSAEDRSKAEDQPAQRGGELSDRVAASEPSPFEGMTRDQFLGSPKITADANASDLKPKVLTTVQGEPSEAFEGGYTAKYSPDGAAVYDGDKVIASYNFGDTLAVDPKYRRKGIAQELVYQWRSRYPESAPATHRTKASQKIQEKVWDRIQAKRGRVEDAARSTEARTIVPPDERRPDWNAETEGRAITALDDLVKQYGGSTLADSIRDDLRETTTAKLIGQKIGSPEDLAALASVYRNPAFETMRYVYVNREGVVLGETAVSSRMPASSVTFPQGQSTTEQWIHDNAPKGSSQVWMIHNHPTGDPIASKADIAITQKMSIKLGDMAGAPKLAGHVILDHDTYGYIDGLGEAQGVKSIRSKRGTPDPTLAYRGDTSMFDIRVTNPEFAAVTGKKIAAATPKDSSAIVIMDAAGRAVSIHTFPNDFLVTPRGAAMLGKLAERRGGTGIGLVTSTENFAKHRAVFDQAGGRGLFRDAIVVNNEGKPLRLNDTGVFPKERRGPPMSRSKAVYKRNDVGERVYEPDRSEPAPVSLQAVRRALEARGMSAEAIANMSRDQLRAEQALLRARSEPTPAQVEGLKGADAEGKVTGIKNATKEEERGLRGKAAVEHDLAQTNPEQYARAKATFDADPHAGQLLAAKVIANPKALTPEESILLSLDAMRIINARQRAYEQASEALDKGDEATRTAAMSLARALDGQLEANDIAARYSGTKAGQALQARKVMIAADYSMARMLLRAKVAKGGELTGAERAKVEEAAAEIARRTKALDEREAKLREREAAAKPEAQKKLARAKFDDLVKQLKAIPKNDHLKEGCVV